MTQTSSDLQTMTPEELTEYFMLQLKNELSVYDLQVNRVGFIGFFINLISNITYDSKLYKDMLFKEAFPATAQTDDKIYYCL